MTKRLLRSLALALSLSLALGVAYARMTDQQVIEYVKKASAQGKSQQTIGKELLARGVTEAQLRRIKESEERKNNQTVSQANHTVNRNSSTNADVRQVVDGTDVVIDDNVNANDNKPAPDVQQPAKPMVYGSNLFKSRTLTFEPNENMATPEDYRLGPGDEIIIDVWGNNEAQIRQSISPEGRIIVDQIGPIYLNGLTVKEANDRIKNIFAQKYADVADSGSDISLSLGQLRTIQVDVMGEVSLPGTYRISPFSTLFHALYNAGGTTDAGSLRGIEVLRNGRRIASADIYDYLFNGKRSNDIRLQEGDVIVVPAYDRLVTVTGEVKRPMIYELKKGETVADLLGYAGGLKSSAFGDRVSIDRTTNGSKTVAVVEAVDFETSRLDDGDIVTIGKADSRYDNRVEIGGAVVHPGVYAIGIDVNTVKELVNIAGNPTEDAFLSRAQLFRENPDLSIKVVGIDLEGILKGTVPDIELNKNDVLVIASVGELEPKGDVIIEGEITRPGHYPYATGMTLEDLIVQAGGLKEGASTVKVDVSRRLDDKTALVSGEEISKNFSLTVKDGLIVDGDAGFLLDPNDIVDIRRSPGYVTQRRVNVTGEVPFEGSYSLSKRTERLSDLVRRAGGVSDFAYLRGAHLTRKLTPEEKMARDETLRLALQSQGNDSIDTKKLLVGDTYSVGIDLDKALANPGGPEDLVLIEGDELVIPELINTVKISGDVLFPNTVIYAPGQKYKYYVEQAGGWGNTANKSRAFVVYMNGRVARAKNAVIEPGCQIIVPSKDKKSGMSLAQWLAIGTSAASLGSMAASIYSIIKK